MPFLENQEIEVVNIDTQILSRLGWDKGREKVVGANLGVRD